MEKKQIRRNITPEDLEAANNLRRIWNSKKRDLRLTQEKVANDIGVTQGAISQYMKGTVALGIAVTLSFARILQVSPKEIRKDFRYNVVSNDLTPEAIEFAYKWLSLPKRLRDAVEAHLDSLVEASSPNRPPDDRPHNSTH